MADRPQLQAPLANSHSYDVVLAESLDRLSRDLELTAKIYKRLKHERKLIWTCSNGDIGDMHVAFKGTMSMLF